MNQMNQIILEGNVVRDCQVKETPRGTRICILPIATNRYYKDAKGDLQKEVAFFDVEAWGENFSSNVAKRGKKGTGLRVVGRIKQNRWKSQEGKSLSKVSIIAEHIEFKQKTLDKKDEEEMKNQAELAAEGLINEASSDYDEGGETVF